MTELIVLWNKCLLQLEEHTLAEMTPTCWERVAALRKTIKWYAELGSQIYYSIGWSSGGYGMRRIKKAHRHNVHFK